MLELELKNCHWIPLDKIFDHFLEVRVARLHALLLYKLYSSNHSIGWYY